MVGIDIQSLFADIIQSPGQRRQSLTAQGERDAVTATRGLTGGAQLAAPLIAQLAASSGMRDEILQRSVGGLFGLDTRNESEKLQQVMQGADTTTAAGLEKVASDVEELGYGVQAATIRQQVATKRAGEDSLKRRQEALIGLIQDANLPAKETGMLVRSVTIDPAQDPAAVVKTIIEMGGETDPIAADRARALMVGPEGSPEYNAYIARGGLEPATSETETRRTLEIDNIVPQLIAQGQTPERARTEAANIVDGNVTYTTTPDGRTIRIDQVMGTADEVDVTQTPEEVPVPQPENTLWSLASAGTGPISALKAGVARTPGVAQFTSAMGLHTAEAVQARAQIKNVAQEAVRGLAVNDKFPMGEMNRIISELAIEPAVWDTEQSYRDRLKGLDTYLETRQAQAERDSRDTSLPSALRISQRGNASTIQNLRGFIGVPSGDVEGGLSEEDVAAVNELLRGRN